MNAGIKRGFECNGCVQKGMPIHMNVAFHLHTLVRRKDAALLIENSATKQSQEKIEARYVHIV